MSKASLKRHADLRKKVSAILMAAKGKVIQDNEHTLEIEVPTERVGPLRFTMFKRDGQDDRRGDSIYSVFCQLPTKKQVEEFAPQVNLVFGQGVHHVMNPFSGKWNIHFCSVQDVLNELEHRMKWLSKKHNAVYSAMPNA